MNFQKYTINLILMITLSTTTLFDIKAQNLMLGNINNTLNKSGINLEFTYTGEVFSNVSGGFERKSVYLDNFDLIFNFDLDKMLGWNGATINTYFLGNHGGIPSEYSGAIQGISNIAAHNTWKLYEFWIEQNFFNDDLSILVGLFDLNSEFDSKETSAIFINPSHGIGPDFSLSGKNGPSIFPTTSLALRAKYNFSNSFNFKAAVLDGIPGDSNNPNGTKIILDKNDGMLLVSEFNYSSETNEFDDYFKYAIGTWYYTDKFEKLLGTDKEGNPLTQKGNYGIYASAEKVLFTEEELTNQGLAAFIRAGIADNVVNQVDVCFSAGINYIGLFPGRDEDKFGIAIAASHNNSNYKTLLKLEDPNHTIKDFEYIFEITYNIALFEFLQIQPDIQYVLNPAGCTNNTQALVLGTRLHLHYNKLILSNRKKNNNIGPSIFFSYNVRFV